MKWQIRALAVFGVIVTIACFWSTAVSLPHGYWDAWAVWNLKARLLADGQWRAVFSPEQEHSDYPILLPSVVAAGWKLVGRQTPAVPISIAGLFTFGTIATIFVLLGRLRGWTLACLATIALTGYGNFLSESAWQYADIPLGFFMAASLGCLVWHDLRAPRKAFLIAAGILAGLAACTKNEGMIFAASLLALRREKYLAAGILPLVAAMLGLSWVGGSGPNEVFSQPLSIILANLTDFDRIQTFLATEFALIWTSGILPFLCIGCFVGLAGIDSNRPKSVFAAKSLLPCIAAVFVAGQMMMLAGPWDIAWEISTTQARLLVQLWPSIVLCAFLAAHSPFDSSVPADSNQVCRS